MEGFREDVRAAAIASTLGLKSVDYAKKRYGKDNSQIRGRKKLLALIYLLIKKQKNM